MKAIIFDFDGVVVDSLEHHLDAWSEAAVRCGLDPLDANQRLNLKGKSTKVIAGLIAGAGKIDLEKKLRDAKKSVLEMGGGAAPKMPGIESVFSDLSARQIPFAIASNAPRSFVKTVVEYHRFQVPVVLGVEDVQNPKPAPDLFLQAAKLLKISPANHWEVIVFEDSPHGLEAAVKSGMIPVGVTSCHDADRLRKSGARLTTPSVAEAWQSGILFNLA